MRALVAADHAFEVLLEQTEIDANRIAIATSFVTTRPLPIVESISACVGPWMVARGRGVLMNTTPCPTNTSSSSLTPSQTKVCDDRTFR